MLRAAVHLRPLQRARNASLATSELPLKSDSVAGKAGSWDSNRYRAISKGPSKGPRCNGMSEFPCEFRPIPFSIESSSGTISTRKYGLAVSQGDEEGR